MVKILKPFLYMVFFIIALIFFIPKISTYYYVEHELKKHKVILSGEEAIDNGLSLELHHVNVSYDAIQSAKVENINIKLLGFYNTIAFDNVKLGNLASSFIPLDVKEIEIAYTVLDPLHIIAYSEGKFGSAEAKVHILDRNLRATIKPSKLMLQKYKKALSMLKKQKNGEYTYDKTF